MINKRGSTNTVTIVFGVIIAAYIIGFVIGMIASQGDIQQSFDTVNQVVLTIVSPFGALLGLEGVDTANQFLMVLVFLLLSVIIIATLDSVNLFGEESQGKVVNFIVGIIVSIIGVRFMPHDLWGALVAPANAFVATVLVGIPFLAFFIFTMKIQSIWARKLLWLFYVVFMSYLIFFPRDPEVVATGFRWAYGIFLFLAVGMMFLDSTIRAYIYKEKVKLDLTKSKHKRGILHRKELKDEMKRWESVLADPDSSTDDKLEAHEMIDKLNELIKEFASSES